MILYHGGLEIIEKPAILDPTVQWIMGKDFIQQLQKNRQINGL